MKLPTYEEILKMSKEAVKAAMAPIRAHKLRLQAETKKANIAEKLVVLEEEVQSMIMEEKVDLDTILDKLDEIALLERRRDGFDKLLQQLFPAAAS